jgi:hypothetical protein
MAAFFMAAAASLTAIEREVGFEGVLRALQWVILGSGEVSQL